MSGVLAQCPADRVFDEKESTPFDREMFARYAIGRVTSRSWRVTVFRLCCAVRVQDVLDLEDCDIRSVCWKSDGLCNSPERFALLAADPIGRLRQKRSDSQKLPRVFVSANQAADLGYAEARARLRRPGPSDRRQVHEVGPRKLLHRRPQKPDARRSYVLRRQRFRPPWPPDTLPLRCIQRGLLPRDSTRRRCGFIVRPFAIGGGGQHKHRPTNGSPRETVELRRAFSKRAMFFSTPMAPILRGATAPASTRDRRSLGGAPAKRISTNPLASDKGLD